VGLHNGLREHLLLLRLNGANSNGVHVLLAVLTLWVVSNVVNVAVSDQLRKVNLFFLQRVSGQQVNLLNYAVQFVVKLSLLLVEHVCLRDSQLLGPQLGSERLGCNHFDAVHVASTALAKGARSQTERRLAQTEVARGSTLNLKAVHWFASFTPSALRQSLFKVLLLVHQVTFDNGGRLQLCNL